jgi:GxxExxY protein
LSVLSFGGAKANGGHGFSRMDTDTASRLPLLRSRAITDVVIGTFFDVYNALGTGFLESVYRNAMAAALNERRVHSIREALLEVIFRGVSVGSFRADLLVENTIVVEIKAARAIDSAHEAQLLNYLRASSAEVGLLLNFGPEPKFRRLLYTNDRKGFMRAGVIRADP